MKRVYIRVTAWFLILWFPVTFVTPVFAQSENAVEESSADETEAPPEEEVSGDPAVIADEDAVENLFGPDISEEPVKDVEKAKPKKGKKEPAAEYTPGPSSDDKKVSAVQNAVLEGIQLSKEAGDSPDESIVSCYFIFRDKPSSYFYEAKVKQKTIVFEFNDVVLGVSPIPSAKEPPIQGFRIESQKVDANKEVVGLNPEWHDILKVSFFFDAIPEITVKDEYSVISYSFRWSTNPEKQKELVKDEGGNKVLLFSLIGCGVALGAAGAYFFLKEEPPEDEQVELTGINDEIIHPDPQ